MFIRLAQTHGLAFGNLYPVFMVIDLYIVISFEPVDGFFLNLHGHITETSLSADYIYMTLILFSRS